MAAEAVLLTGGSSARMGLDKASVVVNGRTVVEAILAELDSANLSVTVLGNEPIGNRAFLKDENELSGPASALVRFEPKQDLVFVIACDVPLFRAEAFNALQRLIGDHNAAIPVIKGREQFLCALYAKSAFQKWRTPPLQIAGTRGVSMHDLAARIDPRLVNETELKNSSVDPDWLRGFNTQQELDDLLQR